MAKIGNYVLLLVPFFNDQVVEFFIKRVLPMIVEFSILICSAITASNFLEFSCEMD